MSHYHGLTPGHFKEFKNDPKKKHLKIIKGLKLNG